MRTGDRRSIRLPEYDYSQPGAYFVTICVQGKQCRLGEVVNGDIQLDEFGHIAADGLKWLLETLPALDIPASCVMPNHLHAVIQINDPGRGGLQTAPTTTDRVWPKPLGRIIGAYKTHTTVQINQIQNSPGLRFWQRNYYERVIRNETEYAAVADYIAANPLNWNQDEYR